MMKKSLMLICSFLLLSASAEVLDSVAYTITKGWNAIFMPVTPTNGADAVFADWPVDKVGFYDQAAFLKTKQFETDASESTLGAVDPGMQVWYRDEPGKSGFNALVANGVYIFNATSAVTKTVVGVPQAMRISWHVASSTNAPLNFVGISTDGENAALTENEYFQGIDSGWSSAQGCIRKIGGVTQDPTLIPFFGGKPKMGNLGVVAMDALKASDWSGVFYVSPATGIDLGTDAQKSVLSVRNDSGTNRTVEVTLRTTNLRLPFNVMFYDSAKHTMWQDNLQTQGYRRELVAGETLTLQIAVNRDALDGASQYERCGGVISVTDVSTVNPSHFRTSVPFSLTVEPGYNSAANWPRGLWLATLDLDNVSRIISKDKVESYTNEVEEFEAELEYVTTNSETKVVSTNYVKEIQYITNVVPVYATSPIPAGSTMTARVLVHVDENGVMTLMQRARVNGRRLSSVVLPTDSLAATVSGTFGNSAEFAWTVGERSRSNPFRHPRHPDHDGLDAYFEEDAPSGDSFSNYLSEVKPELFSIYNTLTLDWSALGAAAAWNPTETLSGKCTWKIKGLRREGAITSTGTFTMKRVAKADLADVEDN